MDIGNYMAESSREISWKIPQPSCPNTVRFSLTSIVPNVQPGEMFPIGRHTIEYTYAYSERGRTQSEVKCDVSFEVVQGLLNILNSIGRVELWQLKYQVENVR